MRRAIARGAGTRNCGGGDGSAGLRVGGGGEVAADGGGLGDARELDEDVVEGLAPATRSRRERAGGSEGGEGREERR